MSVSGRRGVVARFLLEKGVDTASSLEEKSPPGQRAFFFIGLKHGRTAPLPRVRPRDPRR